MIHTVQLHRDSDDGFQTLGRLFVFEDQKMMFRCKTLELPYKDNQRRVSAIPIGKYICQWTMSPRFKRYMYLVTGVANRDGIRFHPANYVKQLAGCVALGSEHKDINGDGKRDVVHSGDTMKHFETLLSGQDFLLEIYDFT